MSDEKSDPLVSEDNNEAGSKARRQTKELLWRFPIEFLSATLVGALILRGFTAVSENTPKIIGFLGIWWLTLLGTFFILLIGIALFFFRKYRQREYGWLEITFALAVGWSGVMKVQATNDIASWTTVVAAAYLVVRGLSNYDEGRIKSKYTESN